MYGAGMLAKPRTLVGVIAICMISLLGSGAGAPAYTHTTIQPRTGYYKGYTHKGRHFSLRVNGRVVYDFRLSDSLLTHAHLTLDRYDQFAFEPLPLRLDGGVAGHEEIRGAFTLSAGHYEHFDVFWHSH